ncbi:MAG: FAD-binding oxidoreductase [Burkholderiales bacterium]|nr:FAD-binding oxidoreductase [Burkholderiales bacterium]
MQHANVWEETAVPAPAVPALESSAGAQVLVIGAGYLGLSTALHLAQAGHETIVVDAHPPGWGASGRNGGQVIPGLKYDPSELETKFGRERGERLWRFAGATADFVLDLVARHGLACSARRAPWIQGIHSAKAAERARRRVEDWQARGAAVAYLDRAQVAAIVGTDIYVGAFADYRAAAVQPLSYARELARAALTAGAQIYRDAQVLSLRAERGQWCAVTANGAGVRAPTVVIATNAYTDDLVPDLARSIVSLNSLQIATAPLPVALRGTMLSHGETLSDTRRVIRYWRLDDAGRLLMGGRGPYREAESELAWRHLVAHVRRHFPALAAVPITHRWDGRVAVHLDYLPRLHRPHPGMLVAIGCQGRGVAWQSAMGAELARLAGDPAYDPVLPITPVQPIPFHRLKAIGVASTIALWRALDRAGLS